MALALPIFAITLFVSAFLLFLVQPMIGKMILPRLGGTPQVWNTCMVFFQMALLAGYGWTHFISTRLKVRMQLIIQSAFLILPLAILLLTGSFYDKITAWTPPFGANPIGSTLWILIIVVGLPFVVVATSAPLLQKWFASTGHPASADPYFLYGASNLGSFLSLLAYPFIFEPQLLLNDQAWSWTYGYALLVLLVLGCAGLVWSSPADADATPKPKDEPAPTPKPDAKKETNVKAGSPPSRKATGFKKGSKQGKKPQATAPKPSSILPETAAQKTYDPRLSEVTWFRRLRWIGLTAVPSSLMLGVTTYITTDLSPIPLLWLIPLMLYLISFVLVFSRWPVTWVDVPHSIYVWIQPFALFALIFVISVGGGSVGLEVPIIVHLLAFFITTMVCHGELAKDRPDTKHLTEFYLLMSVGGMIGGIFNALLAPAAGGVLPFVWEYPFAIFVAGVLRPTMFESDWLDEMLGIQTEGKGIEKPANAYVLDVVIAGVVFVTTLVLAFIANAMFRPMQTGNILLAQVVSVGIPLMLTIALIGKPIRYGLSLGAILLVANSFTIFNDTSEHRDRSYYGILNVKKQTDQGVEFTTLIHGHINHGRNYMKPELTEKWGDPDSDFSRLATTYYHRKGPAGIVMEKYNWFPDMASDNTFWADSRMPSSLVGMGAQALGMSALPTAMIVDLWSEPPFATIGLGTGTMAGYARPFQHMHYYEIDNKVLKMSVPDEGKEEKTYFTYLRDAKNNGAELWVYMGDARLRMAQPYDWDDAENEDDYNNAYDIKVIDGKMGGGPQDFYHMMVVDAFSSDAIPAHLLTVQAVDMYFDKLVREGILCVHTSNRYVDLVPVVADIVDEINKLEKQKPKLAELYENDKAKFEEEFKKFAHLRPSTAENLKGKLERGEELEVLEFSAKRGHDDAPPISKTVKDKGHFTSEWVMVARSKDYLDSYRYPEAEVKDGKVVLPINIIQREKSYLVAPEGYMDRMERYYQDEGRPLNSIGRYWQVATPSAKPAWTDDFYNLLGAVRGTDSITVLLVIFGVGVACLIFIPIGVAISMKR